MLAWPRFLHRPMAVPSGIGNWEHHGGWVHRMGFQKTLWRCQFVNMFFFLGGWHRTIGQPTHRRVKHNYLPCRLNPIGWTSTTWRKPKSPLVRCPNGMNMEPFCNQISLGMETFHVSMLFHRSIILHLRMMRRTLNYLNGLEHLSGKELNGVKAWHGIPATLLHPCGSTLSVTKSDFLFWKHQNRLIVENIYQLPTVFQLTQGMWDWITDAVSGEATSAYAPGASIARFCSYDFGPWWQGK